MKETDSLEVDQTQHSSIFRDGDGRGKRQSISQHNYLLHVRSRWDVTRIDSDVA